MINEVITSSKLNKLHVVQSYYEGSQIRSLNFSRNGKYLVYNKEGSNHNENAIFMLKIDTDELKEPLRTKTSKYGSGVCKFLHNDLIIHTSTHKNDFVRILDIRTQNYLRYFSGHTDRVISLSVSPCKDIFITGSIDKSCKIWDFSRSSHIVNLNIPSIPIVAFHPNGEIFAIAYNEKLKNKIEFHTLSNPTKAFSTIEQEEEVGIRWTGIKFSPDATMVMITTNGTSIKIFCTTDQEQLHNLIGYKNHHSEEIGACFDPTSKFVLGGCSTGNIPLWKLQTGLKVKTFEADHNGPSYHVTFNPCYMNIATGGRNLNLWLGEREK